jgi:hypothetical protein
VVARRLTYPWETFMPSRHKTFAAIVSLLLLAGAGCSSDEPPPSAASVPLYDTFEKIGDAIGCLSMSNSEAETTDIKENKYCTLEKSAVPDGGSVTVYEYADLTHREKSVRAGVIQQQSFLILSETWSLSGDVRDLRMIKAELGVGDLRFAAPEKPSGPGSIGPGGGDEPTGTDGNEAVPVTFGNSVTLKGEKVQADRIYCNAIGDNQKPNRNKPFKSCGKFSLTDSYGDTTRAPRGDRFFLIAFRWKNVSKKPITATSFGTLVTKDGTEYALDEEQSTTLTSNARGNADIDPSGTLNPGKSHRILLAYPIPKAAKAKAIHWGAEAYTDEPPAYALAVK